MNKEILEKIKKVVTSTTQKAVKFSGDAVDFTKLKIKIADVKSKLDDKYIQIGMAVYDEREESDIEAICQDIAMLRAQLEEYKTRLSEYKNQKICSSCGAMCELEDAFCKKCGEKL